MSGLPIIPDVAGGGGGSSISGDIATAANQSIQTTALTNILTTLQNQRVETVWTDDSGSYFIRVDSQGVISWVDVNGDSVSGPSTGARPSETINITVDGSMYQATVGGSGFSAGDYLRHVVTIDPGSGVVVGNFWINVSTNTKLTNAPSTAVITPISALGVGAATATKQDAIISAIQAPLPTGNNTIGNVGLTGSLPGFASAPTVNIGGVALAREAGGNLETINSKLVTTADGLKVDGSGVTQPVSIASMPSTPVTGTFWQTTQPVSVSSLPLPSGAATDLGLAAIVNALGSPLQDGTSITVNAGTNLNTSTLAVENGGNLAAINSKLGGTLTVTANTLPLPTGAATAAGITSIVNALGSPLQEGGGITISDGGSITLGAKSDATYSGSGNASITSILKGIYSKVTSSIPTGSNVIGSVSINGIPTVSIDNLPNIQTVAATSLPLPEGASKDGQDATGVVAPIGGVGIRGWLSGIYAALNNTLSVTGTFWQETQPISGTVTVNAGTDLNTSGLAKENGGQLSSINSKLTTTANGLKVDNTHTTQPVSVTTLPLPFGAATDLGLATIVTTLGNPLQEGGSVVVSNFPSVQAISATSLPLPTNAATSGKQDDILTAIGGLFKPTDLIGNTSFGAEQVGPWEVSFSPASTMVVEDANIAGALTDAHPLHVVVTSSPTSDFAGINLLETLVDDSSGLSVNVKVVNPDKRDVNGALILSDGIQIKIPPLPVGSIILIDTTGYNSLNITTQSMTGTVAVSNDLLKYESLSGTPNAIGALTPTMLANAGYSFPCIGKWIRITVNTAGIATAFLRRAPWIPGYTNPITQGVNVSQIGTTAVVTGGLAGTLAVGGNVAVGSVPTTNPVVTGSIDTTGKVRRLLSDTTGKLQVGMFGLHPSGVQMQVGLAAPVSQSVASLSVQDVGIINGQTSLELLYQILIEMRMLNHQLAELPRVLQGSGVSVDDPQALRDSMNFQ